MSEELKHPWESAAVREQLGIESVWFATAADGIKPDEFQPEVPAEHPLRRITLCFIVDKAGHVWLGEIASRRMKEGEDARSCAWRSAVYDLTRAG